MRGKSNVQVLRTGAVEAVASHIESKEDYIFQPALEARIVRFVTEYAKSLHALGVEPPIAVMISLLRARGMHIASDRPVSGMIVEDIPSQMIDRDQLHFVETVFTAIPLHQNIVGQGMRATLDHLANAAGLSASSGFDSLDVYVNRDY